MKNELELIYAIIELDLHFVRQYGKGSNFYKQVWTPVKRAATEKAREISLYECTEHSVVPCDLMKRICTKPEPGVCAAKHALKAAANNGINLDSPRLRTGNPSPEGFAGYETDEPQ